MCRFSSNGKREEAIRGNFDGVGILISKHLC